MSGFHPANCLCLFIFYPVSFILPCKYCPDHKNNNYGYTDTNQTIPDDVPPVFHLGFLECHDGDLPAQYRF